MAALKGYKLTKRVGLLTALITTPPHTALSGPGGHGEAAGVQGRGQAVPRLRLGGRTRPRRVAGTHPWTGLT